jgi:hypothetical protein
MKVTKAPVAMVEPLDEFEETYVYDIGVDDETPYYFGNDILLHNSCYFSAYEYYKDKPEFADADWSRENLIALSDNIAEQVNESFADFMVKRFNTSPERGNIIKAGRELMASRGLFIKKKKYGLLMYEFDGLRQDKDGKPGKLKPMGLDLKRSDTPKYVQEFLEKILIDLLVGVDKDNLVEQIKAFREEVRARPSWEKGSPKAVNGITDYAQKEERATSLTDMNSAEMALKAGGKTKVNMPGHVRAAINWNKMCDLNKDAYRVRITDGTKVIVCKLRPNPYQITSIAYPVDELQLPKWFRDLPFDDKAMEETIIDKKLDNLLGVLGWDLSKTKVDPGMEFFDFG